MIWFGVFFFVDKEFVGVFIVVFILVVFFLFEVLLLVFNVVEKIF